VRRDAKLSLAELVAQFRQRSLRIVAGRNSGIAAISYALLSVPSLNADALQLQGVVDLAVDAMQATRHCAINVTTGFLRFGSAVACGDYRRLVANGRPSLVGRNSAPDPVDDLIFSN
jgi:hypothetical protein